MRLGPHMRYRFLRCDEEIRLTRIRLGARWSIPTKMPPEASHRQPGNASEHGSDTRGQTELRMELSPDGPIVNYHRADAAYAREAHMSFHTVLKTTKIRHLRLDQPLVVEPTCPLPEVLEKMADAKCACACVAMSGKLPRPVHGTRRLRKVAGNASTRNLTVGDAMTRDLVTLSADATGR